MSLVRALWAALLGCALAGASAERYGDYAASMPLYSLEDGARDAAPPAEDYLERSPDAPLPYDYKYEERVRDKENKQLDIQEEAWQRPSDEPRVLSHHPLDDADELHKNEEEAEQKPKTRRKNRRHRARIKSMETRDREEQDYRLKAASKVRSGRIDKDTVDYNFYTRKGRAREDNRLDTDDVIRETTEKVIRRKPRDRRINLRRQHVDDLDDDDGDLKSLERGDMRNLRREDINPFARDDETEYAEDRRLNSRRFMVEGPRTRLKHKDFPEYDDDYYDMKRVNAMKHKLPDLLRRTQASTTETPRTRSVHPLTSRRPDPPTSEGAPSSAATTPPTEHIVSRTTSTAMTPVNLTTVGEVASTARSAAADTTEASLAEKSRLSILRKAQRKDEVRNATWTTKPPVLMQVTRRMRTMVMVEPADASRAREVSHDSPERLERAKQLMRRKLVAGARNVHELTDNWDELVCDYIDVSLLDGAARPAVTLQCLFLSQICLRWFTIFL